MSNELMEPLKNMMQTELLRMKTALLHQFWPPSRADFRGWGAWFWAKFKKALLIAIYGWLLIAVFISLLYGAVYYLGLTNA